MTQIRIEMEIAATPEDVRAIMLDFARYPEWHTSFTAISATQSSADAYTLQQGDPLEVTVGGMTVVPAIESNAPTEFSWRGSVLGGAFAGKHYFKFLESRVTPSGTTFVHGEDYDGWLSWLVGEGLLGIGRKSVLNSYGGFSQDMKKRAEDMAKLKKTIDETQ